MAIPRARSASRFAKFTIFYSGLGESAKGCSIPHIASVPLPVCSGMLHSTNYYYVSAGCNARFIPENIHKKKGRLHMGTGLESFRRGCLKGLILVQCSMLCCKCEKCVQECVFCTRNDTGVS